MPRTNDIAWPDGFVTAYAMNQANEDFVENIAMYVTHTQTYWDNMLRAAGETGAATINKKFAIVYNYMRILGESTSTNCAKSYCVVSRKLPKLT